MQDEGTTLGADQLAIHSVGTLDSTAVVDPGRAFGAQISAACSYRKLAKAANTLRAFASDWAQFEGWCDQRRLEPLPVRPEAVATYLAALALAGRADSTIGRHLAAIGWRHRQDGLVAPSARDERMVIVDTLAGIRREQRTRLSARKAVISASQL